MILKFIRTDQLGLGWEVRPVDCHLILWLSKLADRNDNKHHLHCTSLFTSYCQLQLISVN